MFKKNHEIITPWNHKNVRSCYFGGTLGGLETNVEFHVFFWFYEFLKVSASIFWLKTVQTSFLSLILNIFQGVPSENIFYVQITIVPGDIDAKKTRKTFQTSHKFFSQCFIVNSSLLWAFLVQKFCENSFSGIKSRKNSIPVIKIIFYL